jgi:hypothetical protein
VTTDGRVSVAALPSWKALRRSGGVVVAAVAVGALAWLGTGWDPSPGPVASVGAPPALTPVELSTCDIAYHLEPVDTQAFAATVTVMNTGPRLGAGWRLTMRMPPQPPTVFDGVQGWDLSADALTSLPQQLLGPGESVALTLHGIAMGPIALPSAFQINGRPCVASYVGLLSRLMDSPPSGSDAASGPDGAYPPADEPAKASHKPHPPHGNGDG